MYQHGPEFQAIPLDSRQIAGTCLRSAKLETGLMPEGVILALLWPPQANASQAMDNTIASLMVNFACLRSGKHGM